MKPNKYIPCQDEFNRGEVTTCSTIEFVGGYAVHTSVYYINGTEHGPYKKFIIKNDVEHVIQEGTFVNGVHHGARYNYTFPGDTRYQIDEYTHYYHGALCGRRIILKPKSMQRLDQFVCSFYTGRAGGRFTDHVWLDGRDGFTESEFPWWSYGSMDETDLFTIEMMGVFCPQAMRFLTLAVTKPGPVHYISEEFHHKRYNPALEFHFA